MTTMVDLQQSAELQNGAVDATTGTYRYHPRMTFVRSLAAWIITADQCADDYVIITDGLWALLTATEREMLHQLVQHGPVWDGDVLSKTTRDFLLELGLASRVCVKGGQGYTAANDRGYDVWKHGR